MDTLPHHTQEGNPETSPRVCSLCAMAHDLVMQLAPEAWQDDMQAGCQHYRQLEGAFIHACELANVLIKGSDKRQPLDERIDTMLDWITATKDISTLACDLAGKGLATGQVMHRYLEVYQEVRAALAIPHVERTSIAPTFRAKIIKRDGQTCTYCKKPGNRTYGPDGEIWHIDHIFPFSLGGTDDESNLTLACASCNMRKHDAIDWEYTP